MSQLCMSATSECADQIPLDAFHVVQRVHAVHSPFGLVLLMLNGVLHRMLPVVELPPPPVERVLAAHLVPRRIPWMSRHMHVVVQDGRVIVELSEMVHCVTTIFSK